MVKDHLRNEYRSISQMCKHWGISNSQYSYRIVRNSHDLEKVLTTKTKRPVIEDHLGNKFSSWDELGQKYNMDATLIKGRLQRGWSIEKILTTPVNKSYTNRNKFIYDHLGDKFNSRSEMCKFYNISVQMYTNRIAEGWSVERALTTPADKKQKELEFIDHKGIKHKTIADCAAYYGMPSSKLYIRLKKYSNLADAIEGEFIDHKGNRFTSYKNMAKHWGVYYNTFLNRLYKQGCTIEEALTGSNNVVTDHLGNKFNSIQNMCDYYNIKYSTFMYRMDSGKTLREALVTPCNSNGNEISDTSLNPLIVIHEYSHTAEGTNDRVFRCTILKTDEIKYMTEDQIKTYPKGWKDYEKIHEF